MAKPFDATMKHLVELHPTDWLKLAGLPFSGEVEVIDADLSAVSAAADKIIRVSGLKPYIAHAEFQASGEPTFDERILFYNVLTRWRHKLPVRSVVFLLRPQAEMYITGKVSDSSAPDEMLEFGYRIVRVWEQPVASILAGGLGTLPLAPISDIGKRSLEDVCREMTARLEREMPAERKEAITAAMILMGLKYPSDMIQQLFRGVRHMKESSIYQAILEEGMIEGQQRGLQQGLQEGVKQGRVEEARSLLSRWGQKRFGPPNAAEQAVMAGINDRDVLDVLLDHMDEVSSWKDLLAFASKPDARN